ncbi:MAG TPA: glycoside hydrolase family 99-like domain-containing protein [Usitatibacteraceae bacterium]|nr:glycoside hydrolase family 99-like domain-containing protein [Usitatibacteraceae bacterium]
MNGAPKLLAMYFPQFHAIPENDAWWGKGFTDWVNVRKAQPQFRGHAQPRVPQHGRYYDQSEDATLEWQIDLARRHGVHGFCHYHYWFDGKQLLETPTNRMLASSRLDFPLCLAWANETWSRRWDGRDHHILQEQTHTPDPARWDAHFEYLFRAWSDDRAIRIDGKPVFLVYRAHRIAEIERMFERWREEAQRRGLPGLYLVAMKQYEFPVPEVLRHFDATMQFQPFEAIYSPDFAVPAIETRRALAPVRMLPEKVQDVLRAMRYRFFSGLTFYDYDTVWKHILKVEREGGIPAFPGAFVDWDNTARYVKRARIFRGATPERFAYWFRQLVEVTARRPENERLIFLNAWNEWAESAYLEPDERHGMKYLLAVRDALAAAGVEAGAFAGDLAAD